MFSKIIRLIFGIASILMFVACGGGGSSDYADNNSSGGSSNFTDNGNGENSANNGSGTTPVTDKTAPVITIKGNNPVTVIQYSTYKDAGATAKDNVDGVVKVITTGSVNSSKIGTYIITYTATDKAGNRATAKRTVKVIKKTVVADTTPPVITIKGDNPATVVQNTTYTDAGATATDTIDGVVTVKVTGNVDTSTLGEYTITYTATDKAGNKATATRKVSVTLPPDTTPPVITITGDNPLEISQGETFSDPGATAVDDRDGTVAVTPSGTVDMSTVGDYTITYTATDKAGNEANATRTVTVKPADVVWEVSNVTEFRQALEDAAANGENDRIILAKGIYNVTSDNLGTLEFDDNEAFDLTIEVADGLTHKDVILDGNNSTQVFNFNNTASSTLKVKGISVINGKNGIYCNQNIEVEDCNISNNSSRGFSSSGTTRVTNSIISNNSSNDKGGGFYSGGATTVTESTISNNNNNDSDYYYSGGGGFYSNGATTVINSTISNNTTSSKYGGGFYSNGITTILNSNISNSSSGYIGGGFYSVSTTILTKSTISNNSANYGGGFYSDGTITITNSTISNNRSNSSNYYYSAAGGGFYSNGAITVTKSTISNNSANYGGGFYSYDGGIMIVTNSLFLNNNANSGDSFYYYNSYDSYNSYISNNSFIGNKGSIYAKGVFVNNIFDSNDADITLSGDSKIYNNYIDYSKIEDNGYNVIKKKNLQPASVGDIYLSDDNITLTVDSPVIDKGLNPSSATYKKIIGGEKEVWNSETEKYETIYPQYEKLLELLKTDKVGNKRVHNNTIDMGAVEYGSSK